MAGFGLAGITNLVMGQRTWVQILGGLFLCYLGARIFRSPPQGKMESTATAGAARGYVSALLLTLTNPMTILSFTAVFAGMGLAHATRGYLAAVALVAGVFCGSMVWWVILSAGVSQFNTHLNPTVMGWINRLSGSVLAGFGLWVLCGSLQSTI